MKILVGYKGVNVGKDLLDIALKHAKAFEAEVVVATSLMGGERTESEQVEEAEKNMDDVRAFFDGYGVSCETHVLVRGMEAGEDLVAFAREKAVDEIIIGVKSRSKVGKLIFGSTAQAVILQASCPVVSVR